MFKSIVKALKGMKEAAKDIPPRAKAPATKHAGEPRSAPPAGRPRAITAPAHAATEEEVRRRAYLKWEAAGRPPGDGSRFWMEAERELRQAK